VTLLQFPRLSLSSQLLPAHTTSSISSKPLAAFDNSTSPNGRCQGKQACAPTNKHKKNVDARSKSHCQAAAAHLEALRANGHFALHEDAGKIAEHPELSQCSDGDLWQQSNAEEIGRLAQGLGAITGTNATILIPMSDMPRGRKATYLRAVSACRPKKKSPDKSAGLSVAIESISQATLAPKLPISSLPKSSSTVSCPLATESW
jgi:hypothetical protein